MTELIKITTNEEGAQVVSARELHEFLGIDTRFNDWISRMIGYGFVENVDYQVLLKNEYNLSGGRPSTDYALTLDTAKEISMIQRSDKGKQARQYFIACEKKLKEVVAKPLTQAELILAQAQALVDVERKLNSVEAKVDRIVKAQEDVMAQLEAIPLVEGEIPEQSARSKVNELVRHYSSISGIGYRDVWNSIYKTLLYNYGINVSGIKAVKPNESKFDKAIRVGHLDTIHLVISEMIRKYQSKLLDR